jgi:hypothetical protein
MLSNRLRISDTSTMMSGYAKAGQTFLIKDSLNFPIWVNKITRYDTAAMMYGDQVTTGYLRAGWGVKYENLKDYSITRFNVAGQINTDTLTVSDRIDVGTILATGTVDAAVLSGALSSSALASITSLGTLSSLNVSGAVTAGSLSAATVNGTLNTAAQPNITSVGTLSSLNVSGTVSAGTLSGVLSSSALASITSLGTRLHSQSRVP